MTKRGKEILKHLEIIMMFNTVPMTDEELRNYPV